MKLRRLLTRRGRRAALERCAAAAHIASTYYLLGVAKMDRRELEEVLEAAGSHIEAMDELEHALVSSGGHFGASDVAAYWGDVADVLRARRARIEDERAADEAADE